MMTIYVQQSDGIYQFNYELKTSPIFFNLQFFFMQVNQNTAPEFEKQIISQSFIEDGLNLDDMKIGSSTEAELPTMTVITNAGTIRGKGRPKGEKNSKERERKPKTILNQENRRRGHWSLEENKRYHWFLQIYNKHFINKEMRRLDKIFKTMAVFIGSREAEQCRSHHQKMQKKYHSFQNIILYLRKFHYASEDTLLLQEDMRNGQVTEVASLLNPRELQELQIIKEVPPTPSMAEEAKVDFGFDEPHKQFQQLSFDLMDEDYQHRLHLDNLLL